MERVSLKDARRRLGALVRGASYGRSVTITLRGKEVAQIIPIKRMPVGPLPDLSEFRASIKVKDGSLTDELIAMRDEERT